MSVKIKGEKVKASFAVYKTKDHGMVCKSSDVAKIIKNWGEIPHKLNDLRAQEISLVAKAYLDSKKELVKSQRKVKTLEKRIDELERWNGSKN